MIKASIKFIKEVIKTEKDFEDFMNFYKVHYWKPNTNIIRKFRNVNSAGFIISSIEKG